MDDMWREGRHLGERNTRLDFQLRFTFLTEAFAEI